MINVYKNELVTIKRRTADALKNVTYSTSTILARVERATKWVKSQTGELVASTIQIYFSFPTPAGAGIIAHGDKIAIDSRDRDIMSIDEKQLFSTNHHKVVYLS